MGDSRPPEPGWYEDEGTGQRRYWDGDRWFTPSSDPAADPPSAPEPEADAQTESLPTEPLGLASSDAIGAPGEPPHSPPKPKSRLRRVAPFVGAAVLIAAIGA